jgi:DeoR family suf operon transcriptional repressor
MAKMTSTRNLVLETLLSHPRSTVNEVADIVEINPISVRHHLISLQAEGLVTSEEERHGVGRPRLIFYLTEKGMEKFPTRYLRLTTRLLDQLKETLPSPVVSNLFTQMAADLTQDYAQEIQTLPLEGRLDLIKKLLAQEGFTVEWEKQGDNYRINEISCPYYQLGQKHPEVCTVDHTLISTMLSIPAEKVQCILNGDSRCSFIINKNAITE